MVSYQASVATGAGGVSFDVKYRVFFHFEPRSVSDCDQELFGIVIDRHLLRRGGAPNSEISNWSFRARKSLFLSHNIPLAALRENSISKILPNVARAGYGCF